MKASALVAVVIACGGSGAPPPNLPVDPPKQMQAAPPPSENPMPTHPWPATKRVDVTETLHGTSIVDPYRWLEDEHAADVQTWMTEQDTYARGELAKLAER